MCGVSGICSKKNVKDIDYFKQFNPALSHRGPDSSGVWCSENFKIGFCHTRLAIQDLSPMGNQPMISYSKRFVISFNGEIYNHLKLRNLIQNHNWLSNSDTETLVELINYFGIEKTLNKLKGMFAFAVYDKVKKQIYLCRDRFGEKPMYYGFFEGNFIFASELKIIKSLKNSNNIDTNALNHFFNYLYIPSNFSIFKKFNKLKPGHYLIFEVSNLDNEKISIYNWYDKKKLPKELILEGEDSISIKLEEKIDNSIQQMQISDRPIGAFLSGGIDSSLICALLSKQSKNKLKTFTIGFEDKNFDESIYAKKIAHHLNTDHHEHIFSKSDIEKVLPMIPNVYDEPFADSSQIPSYLISNIAKKSVTVALTGDGGDELFGGYNRYLLSKKYWPLISKIPYGVRNIFGKILSSSLVGKFSKKIYKAGIKLSNINDISDLYHNLTTELNIQGRVLNKNLHFKLDKKNFDDNDLSHLNFVEKMMYFDQEGYLPDDILCKVDRASMHSSLETRAPFLDHELYEFSSRLPLDSKIKGQETKYCLKKILKKYVPQSYIDRPKMGFSIPLKDYLFRDLKDWTGDIIFDKNYIDPFLDQATVKKIWQSTKDNKSDLTSLLWGIISFRVWFKG